MSRRPKKIAKKTEKTWFSRRNAIAELRDWGDRRWRTEVHKDLKDLVDDDDGIDRLARVIKAILKSKK